MVDQPSNANRGQGIVELLLAANFLEHNYNSVVSATRDNTHGYARSPLEDDTDDSQDRSSDGRERRRNGGRAVHNQNEKDRRAQQKEQFANLQMVIPNMQGKKQSNVAILKGAQKYIQTLKQKGQKVEKDMHEQGTRRALLSERLRQAIEAFEKRHPEVKVFTILERFNSLSGNKTDSDLVKKPAKGEKKKRDDSETDSASEDESNVKHESPSQSDQNRAQPRQIMPRLQTAPSTVTSGVAMVTLPSSTVVPVVSRESVIRGDPTTLTQRVIARPLSFQLTSQPPTSTVTVQALPTAAIPTLAIHTPVPLVQQTMDIKQQLHAKLTGQVSQHKSMQALTTVGPPVVTTASIRPLTGITQVLVQGNVQLSNGMQLIGPQLVTASPGVYNQFLQTMIRGNGMTPTILPVFPAAISTAPPAGPAVRKPLVNGTTHRHPGSIISTITTQAIPATGSFVFMQAPVAVPVSLPAVPVSVPVSLPAVPTTVPSS